MLLKNTTKTKSQISRENKNNATNAKINYLIKPENNPFKNM